jgi:beta-glucosidase
MKRIIVITAIIALGAAVIWLALARTTSNKLSLDGMPSTGCSTAVFPLESEAEARSQAETMLKRMTLDQEVTLLHGIGEHEAPSGTVGATAPISSLGIPALNEQDGPAGIGDDVTGVTQLPAPEDLAATFDPQAAACYGQVIGTEARGKGINLVYGRPSTCSVCPSGVGPSRRWARTPP